MSLVVKSKSFRADQISSFNPEFVTFIAEFPHFSMICMPEPSCLLAIMELTHASQPITGETKYFAVGVDQQAGLECAFILDADAEILVMCVTSVVPDAVLPALLAPADDDEIPY